MDKYLNLSLLNSLGVAESVCVWQCVPVPCMLSICFCIRMWLCVFVHVYVCVEACVSLCVRMCVKSHRRSRNNSCQQASDIQR